MWGRLSAAGLRAKGLIVLTLVVLLFLLAFGWFSKTLYYVGRCTDGYISLGYPPSEAKSKCGFWVNFFKI